MRAGRGQDPERLRILVTRLRYLGDVVLSTPVLETLRERLPNARIEYLLDEGFAPILERHPAVDAVHELPAGAGWAQTLRLLRALRRPRLDWIFDLFGNPRSAVLVGLARPRHSVGPDRGLRSLVYEHRRGRPPGARSAIRHHLGKLDPLLGPCSSRPPSLYVADAEIRNTRIALGLTEGERPVLINPGSTWPEKAWPHERWGDLARALHRGGLGPVLVLDPPAEPGRAKWVAERSGGVGRPLPAQGLRAVMALLRCASLYLGNDGGVLHCAVALRTPTVGLFGPSEPDIWFPYEGWGPYRVVHRCSARGNDPQGRPWSQLREIEVNRVLEAVEVVLRAGSQLGAER